MPPVFTLAPPVTRLDNSLLPGDIVVRVHAEDGDKGAPRDIRYGLVSEGNPFTPFFNISDTTGEIVLARPLDEITAISHVGVPILLTVIAEEVRYNKNEPEAMSTTVQLAFLLGERGNQPPYFGSNNYISRIDENAPQGTAVVFSDPYVPEVSDDDMGKNGVFALALENNNGTFEISPSVGERHVTFIIRVRDNTLLDYESRNSVVFKIVAHELGPSSNLSTTADAIVFITDVNDNPPVFDRESYEVEFPENVTAGTRVVQVHATDVDTKIYGKIRYTQILGYLNTSLSLDPESGIITIATNNHGFDAEELPEYRMYVEAADEDGIGNRATVPLIIKLIDVNDEPPVFERPLYEFILTADLRNFTVPAFIKATDRDVSPPNNIVRYELITGNYENKFVLNEITGELTLREALKTPVRTRRQAEAEADAEVYILTARAYDLGIPHLQSTCQIHVYPPESRARTMLFIVAGKNPDRAKTEETLAALTGGRVTIQEIRPYSGDEVDATDVTAGDLTKERSVVVASVSYSKNSVVDVSQLQHKLGHNKTTPGGTTYSDDAAAPLRAENSVLFWLLMIIAILIAIAVIILILCCICVGCPLYVPPKKRIVRVNSSDDDVHLVVKEKGLGKESNSNQSVRKVRATRKEAWSADLSDSRTRPTQWQFNRRNIPPEEINGKAEVNGMAKTVHLSERPTLRLRDGPNVIYTKELQQRNQDMYIEDYEGEYPSVSRLEHETRLPNRADEDVESLRRHEIDRGSERGSIRKLQRQHATEEDGITATAAQGARDQLFIREGNTEILRLLTRGKSEEDKYYDGRTKRPMTILQQPQYVMVDNGKDILLQRFIEQQQILQTHQQELQNRVHNIEIQKSNAPSVVHANENDNHPAASEKDVLMSRNELLEASLRQQNALLRQILLEKERLQQKQTEISHQEELRLETQSLPAHSVIATQTDCDTGTQTEPQYLLPERRKTRSDNDDSMSDDDDYRLYVVNGDDGRQSLRWIKHRKYYKRRKRRAADSRHSRRVVDDIKRKIRTPILEESESAMESLDRQSKKDKVPYGETKASMLRRLKNENMLEKRQGDAELFARLKKDVLLEIAHSLEDGEQIVPSKTKEYEYESDGDSDERVYTVKAGKFVEFFSEDSLDSDLPDDVAQERATEASSRRIRDRSLDKLDARHGNNEMDPRRTSSVLNLREQPKETKVQRKVKSSTQIAEPAARRKADDLKTDASKSSSRYMQWYKKPEDKPKAVDEQELKKGKKMTTPRVSKRLMADTQASANKKLFPSDKKLAGDKAKEKTEPLPVKEEAPVVDNETGSQFHPLVQHSEYRYEHPFPLSVQPPPTQVSQHLYQAKTQAEKPPQPTPRSQTPQKPPRNGKREPAQPARVEEDYDSGIAMATLAQGMKKKPITEKKSVFAIAYDDVHTKQLRPESNSP